MGKYFDGAVEVEGVLVVPGEEVQTAEEYEGIIIQDADVPLGYEEDNCVFHNAMLILTFLFALYNLVRVIMRAKVSSKKSETELKTE